MKTLAASAALAVALAATLSPALARTGYVTDDAHLFSDAAVAQVNQQAGDLYAQTHKEVVVVTTPSLAGATIDSAIEKSFAQLQVNGVEIYISKADHAIKIAGDTASSRFFPTGSYQSIATSMRASFKAGDYDGGIENAVSLIVNTYRGHESSLNHRTSGAYAPAGTYGTQTVYHRSSTGGFPMGWIFFLIVLAVIFFIVRGVFRAMTGANRMYPPGGNGYGGPGGYGGGPGYGGPGYGGPGYGGGYGYGGGMGGGGFFSGLLGGLGGAWLGNEMFGGNRGNTIIEENGNQAGFGGGYDNGGQNTDAGGWANDPGQIDTSNMGGSDWGGGGGGDWGGGGSDGGAGGW